MVKPKVIVHSIASVDGRIALTNETPIMHMYARWQAAEGPRPAFDVGAWLKEFHQPQVILEGSGSFVADSVLPEPLPPVEGDTQSFYNDFLPASLLQRPGHKGWFTAVDSRGRVRGWVKEWEGWEGWHLLVLVAHNTSAEYLAYLQRENIPYIVAGEERVDLAFALEKLHTLLGVISVLSQAGGKLNGALLRAGLVDELNIEFFPAVIGGFMTPSLYASPNLKPEEHPTRLKLLSSQVQDGDRVWLRYQVLKGE